MSQAVADQVRDARLPTIVVNDTWRLAPWADILYAADGKWWDVHAEEVQRFEGLKVTVQDCKHRVLLLRQTGAQGFDPDPACLRTGGNSGYQAVHVALHAGAARVLLCGFDMKGAHWFGEHQRPLRNTTPHTFRIWIGRFKSLAAQADIVNCTPGSALECFRRMNLEAALAAEKEEWLAAAL
jgi:hypothetical protein